MMFFLGPFQVICTDDDKYLIGEITILSETLFDD